MKLHSGSLLLFLLIAAVICAFPFSRAMARNPVPAREMAVSEPSYADPGEDPHLQTLVVPLPEYREENGYQGAGSEENSDCRREIVKSSGSPLNKFNIFLYSIYRTVDTFIF